MLSRFEYILFIWKVPVDNYQKTGGAGFLVSVGLSGLVLINFIDAAGIALAKRAFDSFP